MNTLIGTPSSRGSAEVLARGTNSYTSTWSEAASVTFMETWDKWDEFPTVVRVGNFVYCWQSRVLDSSINRQTYTLIDIVPDPEDPNRLGRNVAYPYITETTDEVERILTGYNTIETVSETNFVLDIENIKSESYSATEANINTYGGYFQSSYSTFEKALLSFEDGSISAGRISRTSAGTDPHRLYGWGGVHHLLLADGSYGSDKHQFLFAPVFDYNQFTTLYGKESDWSRPSTVDYKWLFESNDTTYPLVQFADKILPHAPFTIATPTTNTEFAYTDTDKVKTFDDIKVDDGPDLADLLKGAAIGAAIACNKDLIAKAAEKATAELKNMASKAMEAGTAVVDKAKAAGSTALQGLQEKAGQVKDSLVAKLPEIPEKITNLHDAITNLDLADLEAVKFFKEKYGDLVDNIDDLLSKFKLPDFDICDLMSISHEKSPKPENPSTAPVEPARNNAVPQVGASQPVTNGSGLTKEDAEAANRTIGAAWKRVEVESLLSALANPETAAAESNAPKGWVPVIKDGKVVGHKKPTAVAGKEYYSGSEFLTDEYQSADIPRVISLDPAKNKEVEDLTDYILNGPQ